MNLRPFIAAALLLVGCSASDQMRSAEHKESATISKSDAARAAVMKKVADYNREARYAISLMNAPGLEAAGKLLDQQYNLTGAGNLDPAQVQKLVARLVRDNRHLQSELAIQQAQDKKLLADETQTTQERDQAVAVTHALANENASLVDKHNAFVRDVIIILVLLAALFVLYVLFKVGLIGASIAAKVP